MVGGDEVQDEMQTLTNEDTKKEEEADVEGDALLVLLKRTIDTIMMEELFQTNRKMNLFRNVLAKGVSKFAEKHEGDTAKMDLFVDSFRAAWKTFKQHGDHEKTMDVFMKTMNNELWISEDTKAWLYTWSSNFTFLIWPIGTLYDLIRWYCIHQSEDVIILYISRV